MLSSIAILIIAFFSLIVLMIIHEFGHFIVAKIFGVRVDEFGIGYPPRIFGKKIGETIYSINLLPLGAFIKIYGEESGIDDYRSFTNLKIWKRILIVLGGVIAFWIVAMVIFSIIFAMGTEVPIGDQDLQELKDTYVKIILVSPDSPAFKAGLKPGDLITRVKAGSGILEVDKIKDFQNFINNYLGQEIILSVKRGNQDLDFNLTPRISPPEGQGALGIGLERIATLIKKYSWYMAPVQGVIYTWHITVKALSGLYQVLENLATGKGAPEGSELAGPLGITVFLANAASYGVGFFLYFIGIISVLVAIFNLFPIPALDGGKLIFLIIEKIKGKPVSHKVEQSITVLFFLLLITLSIFITIKFDIPRFADFLKSALQG